MILVQKKGIDGSLSLPIKDFTQQQKHKFQFQAELYAFSLGSTADWIYTIDKLDSLLLKHRKIIPWFLEDRTVLEEHWPATWTKIKRPFPPRFEFCLNNRPVVQKKPHDSQNYQVQLFQRSQISFITCWFDGPRSPVKKAHKLYELYGLQTRHM